MYGLALCDCGCVAKKAAPAQAPAPKPRVSALFQLATHRDTRMQPCTDMRQARSRRSNACDAYSACPHCCAIDLQAEEEPSRAAPRSSEPVSSPASPTAKEVSQSLLSRIATSEDALGPLRLVTWVECLGHLIQGVRLSSPPCLHKWLDSATYVVLCFPSWVAGGGR